MIMMDVIIDIMRDVFIVIVRSNFIYDNDGSHY